MGFRFQRRVNLGRGLGLNISKSGISPSVRTRYGSLGTKGFSLRTGIPGLTYRQGFGRKSGGGAIVGLILIVIALLPFLFQLTVMVVRVLAVVAAWLIQILIIAPFNLLCWLGQSLADYIASRMNRTGAPNASAAVPAPQAQPQQLTDRRDFQVIGTILLVVVGLVVFKVVNMPASDSSHFATQPGGTDQSAGPAQTVAHHHRHRHRRVVASLQPRRKSRTAKPPTPILPRSTTADAEPEATRTTAAETPDAAETLSDVLASVKAKDPQAAARIQTFCANVTETQKCDQMEEAAWTRIVVENEFPQLDPAIIRKCSQPPFPSNSYVAEEACAKYELHKDAPALPAEEAPPVGPASSDNGTSGSDVATPGACRKLDELNKGFAAGTVTPQQFDAQFQALVKACDGTP